MAVAALRPDGAARALRRREFRCAAEAVPQLSRGLGVSQREAGAGALSPIHAVRRRYGRRGLRRGGCGDLHDGRGYARARRHPARRLRHQGEQPQGPGRGDGGDRARRRGRTRGGGSRSCARSTSSTGWDRTACASCSAPGARTRAAISRRAPGSRAGGHRWRASSAPQSAGLNATAATGLGDHLRGRPGLAPSSWSTASANRGQKQERTTSSPR